MSPRNPYRPAPALKLLSLGAGVQSSTLLLLAAHGAIPTFDYALFADPGWGPPAGYAHVRRLEAVAADAGTPLLRVAAGNIRDEALDPKRCASMPLFIEGPRGERTVLRRHCAGEYKTRPLKREARR